MSMPRSDYPARVISKIVTEGEGDGASRSDRRAYPLVGICAFRLLVMRGLKARRPGETTLFKLAVIPVLLLLMGINELWRVFGFAVPEALV